MDKLCVIQADRDAAAAYLETGFFSESQIIRAGEWDTHPLARAMAAHRIASQAELREALVQASEWVSLLWPQMPLTQRRNLRDAYRAHQAKVSAALSHTKGEGE